MCVANAILKRPRYKRRRAGGNNRYNAKTLMGLELEYKDGQTPLTQYLPDGFKYSWSCPGD